MRASGARALTHGITVVVRNVLLGHDRSMQIGARVGMLGAAALVLMVSSGQAQTDGVGFVPDAVVTATRIEADATAPTGLAQTTIVLPVGTAPSPRLTALPSTRWSCRAWQRPGINRVEMECRYGGGAAGSAAGGPPGSRPSLLVFDGDTIWQLEASERRER